jgi:plasmid stabilization system protein ParE
MSYRVEWSAKSVSDLSEHVAFLKKVSKEAAKKMSSAIVSMADSLAEFPERCPEFSMPRNFPVPIRKCIVDGRYILLFGVRADSVMIYRVLDARRSFDGLLS